MLETSAGVEKMRKEAQAFWLKGVTKYIHGIQNIDVTGDYVTSSKNSRQVFDSESLEDSKFINHGHQSKSVYDGYVVVDGSESSYEIVSAIALNNVKSSYCTWHGFDITYADTCENSDHLFGCIGIKKKQYCILNKQYTKEEYTELVEKILKHIDDMPYVDQQGRTFKYGEYFPPAFSPFAYNETAAQEYFPSQKEYALAQGYDWKEPELRNYTIDIKPSIVPNDIRTTEDTIVGKVIGCIHGGTCSHSCTTAFKITPEEFQLYQKLGIPIPNICPNCRHGERFSKRNPLKLYQRICACDLENHSHTGNCKNGFETTYAPNRPEIIYCEDCYKAEVM